MFHGVMAGDMPLIGLGAEPKNIPVAAKKGKKKNLHYFLLVAWYYFCKLIKKNKKNTPLTSCHADARDVGGNLHAVFAFLSIQQQVETAGACRSQLPEHDVFRHALHGVAFSV